VWFRSFRVKLSREANYLRGAPTESIWLRRLILRELQALSSEDAAPPHGGKGSTAVVRGACSQRGEPTSSLYVRLHGADRLLLHERAAARGMAKSTYVSVLVRSHLRSLTPLPKDELVALKRAVSELGAIGRNLNQIARAANQGGRVGGVGQQEFRAILKICEALRDHTKSMIKANAASWSAGCAESAD
jgi:Bacterial mobilisation protein (MobC)